VATVTIPLLALHAGYDAAAVGFLTATSAVSQLGGRLGLPWLLGRFPDRTLIGLASLMMAVGFGLLLVSTSVPVFVVAQLCQGTARAIFWTGSQTHAVRSGGRPVDRLVDLNVAGNAGTLIGPVLAGSLAVIGLPVAVAAAALGAAAATIGTPLLQRLPPYDRARSAGTIGLLRRDGVDVACWASVVGGGWWSMIGSYVPVILVGAGMGPQLIGWLVTASEGAGTAALLLLRRMPVDRIRRTVRTGALVAAAMFVAIAIAPGNALLYALLLVVGGAASGAITTLAPAMVSLASGEHEQGDALALSGTFRAGALLACPAAVGALLSALTLSFAVALVGSALGLSGVLVGRPAAGLRRGRTEA
jgi:MFS family permease